MVKQNKLAIVIPAYKATFLAAALDSIAAQTCQDFTLYIGDDCSPHQLGEIVERYRNKINLVYKRFDTNLGGKDLVAQWERCIDMSQDEEWIWLFSDDDVMEPQCVEEFYKTIMDNPQTGLVHFDICRLDDATAIVTPLPVYPKHCSAKFYLDEKTKGHIISFVVEFIVRRDIFFGQGRFQNFDLAWGSDFISWLKFADAAGGIDTCGNAKVLWRKSDENISPNFSNPVLYRKMISLIRNAKWLADFTTQRGYGNKFLYTRFVLGQIKRNRSVLSKPQKQQLFAMFLNEVRPTSFYKYLVLLLKSIL